MEKVLRVLLIIHILSGLISLTSGCIAMAVKKGDKTHRLSGKIFFCSMLGVAASALIISLAKNNGFLLMIAIFSFYQNYMGYRAIKNKSLRPSPSDWLVLICGAVNTFFMISSMNIVLMVFGGISFFLVARNLSTNLKTKRGQTLQPLSWLKLHIGMMMGAYIATITAFVVVNSRFFASLNLPQWLPWLFPTLLLVPLMGYFTKKYTSKTVGKSRI
ncbi:MAG TPA: DUF2306 domain-containing protein [Bacteroidia bacterium]|nr:DUF2306 domain-containing protein [Bacteroidia bacterium]